MTEDLDRFWRDHQRQNNEAAAREAQRQLQRQQAEHHERMMERQRRELDRGGPSAVPVGGGDTDPVAIFFGAIGALFGGVLQPFGMHWFFAGFFGFLFAGVAAGMMKATRIGRAVLWIVGLGFVGLVAAAIMQAEKG